MNNSFFGAIEAPLSNTDKRPLRKKRNAVITGIMGILYFSAASVFASEGNLRYKTGDTNGTDAITPSTKQLVVDKNGIDVVHRGMNRLKSGKDTVETGQIINDKSVTHRGIKIMSDALTMIDLGKTMIKKELDMMAYIDTSTTTEANNEKAGHDVADNLSMMYNGMTLMTKGKLMTKDGMDSIDKDLTMGMDFLEKGILIMEKGMTLIDTGRSHKLTVR